MAKKKQNIASIAASHANRPNGVLRGGAAIPGGREESVVVNVAVQKAPEPPLAAAGVQVAAAPRFALPFRNCTVPVGPFAELLLELTLAVSVTLPPEAILLKLDVTAVVVVAFVMVTDKALLLDCEV